MQEKALKSIILTMTDIRKFLTDAERLKKHERQNNSGKCDYNKIQADLCKLFGRAASCTESLTDSIFSYWENEYIFNSQNFEEEPTAENLGKLGAILAFLGNSDEDEDLLNEKDWQELGELVNYEADDLPVDLLQDLMRILVSKGAY